MDMPLEKAFAAPPDLCRGTDFWMLNDALDEGELRRQLRAMRSQGVASVIARTYIGLRSDYPGADWMQKMRVVVDEARQLGMTVFMQAGYMPEAVLNLPPEYSLGDIRCYPAGHGEGERLDSHGGIDYCHVKSMSILDMLSPEACAFYVKQSYEDMWKDFKEDFGKTILSVWVDEPSFRKVSLPWTDRLPDTYAALWGEAFPMDQLHLLFVDGEGDRLLRLRYWRTVLHLMKNAYFKSVRDWCNANGVWFSGHLMAEDTMESQISATCFTMPMYKYFDIPGIDYLTAQMHWVHGEIKPEKPYNRQWPEFAAYTTPLQCSSAAHQAGQNVVLAEMYGVSTENLGLRDQKQMFDHFASLGINHRSVHGLFYSLRGRGKRAYPPHVHDYQPYWPKYHLLTDALARESAFVRAGVPVKDVLLLHPIETGFSLYHGVGPDGAQHNAALQREDQAFSQTVRALVGMQANFEMGDEDTIAEMGALSAEGKFTIGQMTYGTVILPRMAFIRESTLALLKEFLRGGGTVLALDGFPAWTDAGRALDAADFAGAACVKGFRQLADALSRVPMAYRFEKRNDDTGVQIFLRREQDSLLFFLTNADCHRGAAGTLVVPGAYGCERFQERDGSIAAWPAWARGGETCVPIDLPEGGSMMLRLRPGAPRSAPAPQTPVAHLALKGEWRIRRENPNALVLEMFRYARAGEALSAQAFPVLAIQDVLLQQAYVGEIELEARFCLKDALHGLRLALESPRQQRLWLDGAPLPNAPDGNYITFAFETLPLPPLAAGEHTLTIRRHFEPLRKPTSTVTSLFENLGGVELEPVLLTGDFAAHSALEPAISGCVRMNEDFVLAKEAELGGEEAVCRGYPFYCGVMEWQTEFSLPERAQNPRLALDGLYAAAAEVSIDGIVRGDLCWAPYRVFLGALAPGKHALRLRLFGTLRNLLGPWHRPVGEVGACWGGYDAPNLPWLGLEALETGKREPNWYLDRMPDRDGWTESYLLLPMGIVGARVEWDA